MQRIIVTGATSMIGVALIEECISMEQRFMQLYGKGQKSVPVCRKAV